MSFMVPNCALCVQLPSIPRLLGAFLLYVTQQADLDAHLQNKKHINLLQHLDAALALDSFIVDAGAHKVCLNDTIFVHVQGCQG